MRLIRPMKANLRENFIFQNDNDNMSIGVLTMDKKKCIYIFLSKYIKANFISN